LFSAGKAFRIYEFFSCCSSLKLRRQYGKGDMPDIPPPPGLLDKTNEKEGHTLTINIRN
jgi:hypothetical protein